MAWHSSGSPWSSSRRMSGWCRPNSAIARGMRVAPAVANQPSRSRPVRRPARACSSRSAAARRPRTSPALATRTRPGSVSTTPRGPRTTKVTPASRSREAICCDTADGVYAREQAAAVKEPQRTTSTRIWRRRTSSIKYSLMEGKDIVACAKASGRIGLGRHVCSPWRPPAHSPAGPAADAGTTGGGRPRNRRHGRRRDLRARRGDGRDGRSGRPARLSAGLRGLAGDRPALCRAGLPAAAGRWRLRLRPGGARPRVGVPHGLGLLGGVRAAVRVRDPWVRRLPERGHRVAGPPGSGRPRHRLHRLEPSRGEGIRAGPNPRGPDRPGRTGRLRRLGAARARPDPVAALRPPRRQRGAGGLAAGVPVLWRLRHGRRRRGGGTTPRAQSPPAILLTLAAVLGLYLTVT